MERLVFPLEFLAGLAGIGITFSFINTIIQGALGITEELTLVVTPLLYSDCLWSFDANDFYFNLFPCKKSIKISAIDAIRQTQDVKLVRESG